MIADVIDLLRCPHCAADLSLSGGTAGCSSGHRFDVARQGHLTLLRGPAGATADTAAMVADRAAFLAKGHYARIAELVSSAAVGTVAVEPGAGTGYYLDAVVARRPSSAARGVATDLSAYSCRRAAKLPRIGAVVADTWAGLPIRDEVADTVLAVFAPRNLAEFARICARSGRVLVVTPLPDHLGEVRRARGLMAIEEGKHERLLNEAIDCLVHDGQEELRYELMLPRPDIALLIGMGPNAFHAGGSLPRGPGGDRPAGGSPESPFATTVAVRLDVFRPRSRQRAV